MRMEKNPIVIGNCDVVAEAMDGNELAFVLQTPLSHIAVFLRAFLLRESKGKVRRGESSEEMDKRKN